MVGVDEVGRGAWAGPLLVCAARLHGVIDGLKDSKQLSKQSREQLASEIINRADVGYGWAEATEIDRIGLAAALKRATDRALADLSCSLDEQIIIDGTVNLAPGYRVRTMIKADCYVPEVSAASIVAKVARDEYMRKLAALYPAYGFERHVGYGTALHREAITRYGLTPQHRQSFKIKTI